MVSSQRFFWCLFAIVGVPANNLLLTPSAKAPINIISVRCTYMAAIGGLNYKCCAALPLKSKICVNLPYPCHLRSYPYAFGKCTVLVKAGFWSNDAK
jgi:hypothetical protein